MDENNTYENRNGNEGYSEHDSQRNGGYSGYNNPNYNNQYQPHQQHQPRQPYQQYQQYQQYQPYANIPPYNDSGLELEEPVKVGEWILSFIILMIPCVNIIMMFVWAFSSTEKKSKSNFFKAYLILFAIATVLTILISFAMVILTML